MPELPEVETVRRGLAPIMENAVLERLDLRRPNLRYPFPDAFAEQFEGQKITSISRRAKYLMMYFANGNVLVSHLGMSGSFRIHDINLGRFHHSRSKVEVHDHVIFYLKKSDGNDVQVIYNDPRRFGFMFSGQQETIFNNSHLASLGYEPTGNALNGTILARMFYQKSASLKTALLDQKLVAGLGNIYVCEALWRSGLSPKRKADTLVKKNQKPTEKCIALASHIREVINDAIQAGGSSLRDHVQTDGSLGYFQHRFAVYDRENQMCRNAECNQLIKRIVQSGRSTFYCPICQR